MKRKKIEFKTIDGIVYKKCNTCNEFKTLSNFHKSETTKWKYTRECKECVSKYKKTLYTKEIIRDKNLSVYGITNDDYLKLYKLQEGKCLICKGHFNQLNIDHCHKTNVIRGLLCGRCNKGLGHFQDDLILLANAYSYLLDFLLKKGIN